MRFIEYILIASVCLGLFYIAYRMLFGGSSNFRHARFFLLLSVGLSLLIPLTDYEINTGISWFEKSTAAILIPDAAIGSSGQADELTNRISLWDKLVKTDLSTLALWVYITITMLFLVRILFMIAVLTFQYTKAYKVHLKDYILLYNHSFRNTFSFFNWIFINQNYNSEDDLEQIIAHEKIHANQYHSLDILLIELLTAVMWFNPFIWMIKNSLQLVHEYLADDGALGSGIDRLKYQALLINQVAEERLICLSSSFNHSLIKKRIIMMTNSRFQRKSLIRLLALLPVAFSLFLLMAVFNGLTGQDVRASETPTLSMISIDPGTAGNSAELPPDTIIKKTIIKRISKENPNDTIIEEKEEIIVGEKIDIQNESDIVRHRGGGRSHVVIINDGENETMEHRSDGERHEVRVRSEIGDERRVHVVESDVFIEEGDSIKHIKVIKHGDGDMMEVNPDKKVIIRHSSGRESDILYIIDGKEFSDNEAMNNLDPDDIESMSVYKGEDAKKYTDKDYEGVIVIVTKNGKKK